MRRSPARCVPWSARPLAAAALLLLTATAGAAPPPLPGPNDAGAAGATPSAASPSTKAETKADPKASVPEDAARKGLVQIEANGRPMAAGVVLARDGRVLTSLSGLGPLEQVDVRFADGSVVKARVGHRDKSWDLALLVPLTGKWLDGLVPSSTDPATVEMRTFLPQKGKLGPAHVTLKGRPDAHGRDGALLRDVLELEVKGGNAVLGAPVLEPGGNVLGLIVRGCAGAPKPAKEPAEGKPAAKDAAPCTPTMFAAPVYALRGFLMKTPADAVQPAPWLGLGGAPNDGRVRGVRVVGLAPGSPAEKAGLKAGGESPDTIVAVDGQPVETPEQLAEVIGKRGVGQTIKLLVFSGGAFREAPVTLSKAP